MIKSGISYLDYNVNAYNMVCTPVSEGCRNCYARAQVERFGQDFHAPLKWSITTDKRLRTIPGGSICGLCFQTDVWHEDATLGMIKRIHQMVASRPDVTFVYTTKRADRMRRERCVVGWPDNLYVGVSVELPKYLARIECLKLLPAAHKWVSFEPLLADMGAIDFTGIDAVIVGAESGATRRKDYQPRWAENIRLQTEYWPTTKFYYKQGSDLLPGRNVELFGHVYQDNPFAAHRVASVSAAEQLSLF